MAEPGEGFGMSDSIDHAAEAFRVLQLPTSMEDATEANALAYAQVHATLALVEQQRIANLIALANCHPAPDEEWDEPMNNLVAEAQNALCGWDIGEGSQFSAPDEYPVIRDEIRRGLGL